MSDCAITFVSTDVTGTSVDENYPYAALKNWLQVKQYWEEKYTKWPFFFVVQFIKNLKLHETKRNIILKEIY